VTTIGLSLGIWDEVFVVVFARLALGLSFSWGGRSRRSLTMDERARELRSQRRTIVRRDRQGGNRDWMQGSLPIRPHTCR